MTDTTTPVVETVATIQAWLIALHGAPPTPRAALYFIEKALRELHEVPDTDSQAIRERAADVFIAITSLGTVEGLDMPPAEEQQQAFIGMVEMLEGDCLKGAPRSKFSSTLIVNMARLLESERIYEGVSNGAAKEYLKPLLASKTAQTIFTTLSALVVMCRHTGTPLLDAVQSRMATNRELSGITA